MSLFGTPVNQEVVVPAPFAQHRVGAVTVRVDLAVDGDARHQLQQVEIVASVDGQLGDLARRDGAAGRGGRRVYQGERTSTAVSTPWICSVTSNVTTRLSVSSSAACVSRSPAP